MRHRSTVVLACRDKTPSHGLAVGRRLLPLGLFLTTDFIENAWEWGARSAGKELRQLSPPCLDTDAVDPVACSARKTRFDGLPIKVRTLSANKRWVDALESVDVDDGVQAIGDLAGHEGYRSASGANVERRRFRSEHVLRHRGPIANPRMQCRPGLRCPDAAMLGAKSAAARTRGDRRGIPRPVEREGDIAAVAFAVDPHLISPLCFRHHAVRERGAARQV